MKAIGVRVSSIADAAGAIAYGLVPGRNDGEDRHHSGNPTHPGRSCGENGIVE